MTTALQAIGVRPVRRRAGVILRLLRKPQAAVSLALIIAFITVGVIGPMLINVDPNAQDYAAVLQGPSSAHPFGTDELGRDTFARWMYGARTSLIVALSTTMLVFIVGVPIGLVAGYYGKWLDAAVSRSLEVLLAFPYLVIALGLAAILGPSVITVTIALATAQLPWLVRIVRGEVLSLREGDMVAGAIVDGARDRTIIFRHLLPNLTNQLVVMATLLIPFGILGEAMLSFLGLGVRPPVPTWGVMLSAAQPFAEAYPMMAILPGVTIVIVTLAFNILGDCLRDVLDPRMSS